MSIHQLQIANIVLPPGANLTAQEWEEKKAALATFAHQLFNPSDPNVCKAATDDPNQTKINIIARVRPSDTSSWADEAQQHDTEMSDEPKTCIVGAPGTLVYPSTFSVRMGTSPIHGRGMFATKDFQESEIIEVCPTLEVHHSCIGGILEDYVYYGDKKEHRVVVMGYGMMYNSWSESNMWYYRDKDDNFVFVATRAVKAGEELCIDYGSEWWGSRDHKDKIEPGADEKMSQEGQH
jgi:hypothetical protein